MVRSLHQKLIVLMDIKCSFPMLELLIKHIQLTYLQACVLILRSWGKDDKPVINKNFLPLGKKESCASKGCMCSLMALKGRHCICAALRAHMSQFLLSKYSRSRGFPAKFITVPIRSSNCPWCISLTFPSGFISFCKSVSNVIQNYKLLC